MYCREMEYNVFTMGYYDIELNYWVYAYMHKRTKEVVYVGIDGSKDKSRNRSHYKPAMYDQQEINKVLQKAPKTYICVILAKCHDKESAMQQETHLIFSYKPKYNIRKI